MLGKKRSFLRVAIVAAFCSAMATAGTARAADIIKFLQRANGAGGIEDSLVRDTAYECNGGYCEPMTEATEGLRVFKGLEVDGYLAVGYRGLVVDGNGRVGIGTSVPSVALDVRGQLRLPPASSVAGDLAGLTVEPSASFDFNGQFLNATGVGFHAPDAAGGVGTYVSGKYGVDLFAGGLRRLRIDGSGKVSIGQTAFDYLGRLGVGGLDEVYDIAVIRPNDARLMLNADTANTTTDANAWIYLTQHGTTQRSYLGLVGADDKDPSSHLYQGTLANALLLGTSTKHVLQLGANSRVRMTIDVDGMVGIGMIPRPRTPIDVFNKAYLSLGGRWKDASSRTVKRNIRDLTSGEAREALAALVPVRFDYAVDPAEHALGFIAEDVPDLVAGTDRTSLSPMDIAALAVKVIQDQEMGIRTQQEAIAALLERVDRAERRVKDLEERLDRHP